MRTPVILYTYVFAIIPLLLFMGISILTKKNQFRLFPIFSIIILVLVLIIHTSSIVHFAKSMFTGEKIPVQKALGIFILFLAVALLILNSFLLAQYYKKIKISKK
jgi:hypothetical protein